MSDYINIYSLFETGAMIPFIEISKRPSDKFETFILGVTTYDDLSYKYYGNSLLGRIISMGNPEYLDEMMIEDGKSIRIPFPFSEVKKEIQDKINNYNLY